MNKGEIRNYYRTIRSNICLNRRKECSNLLCERLRKIIDIHKKIVSFVSINDEIDLSLINEILINEGKLYLPKINENQLECYHIKNIKRDTTICKYNIVQPNSNLCQIEDAFDCVLVPAIVFDEKYNRIGYGFGYYDRFLQKYKNAHSVGVGFREQLSNVSLPCESHDVMVNELCLV